MLELADYFKIFVSLLLIVDPIGVIPLFISMTQGYSVMQMHRMARIASISVGIVLVVSVLIGEKLLALFGITIASFKVGTAILILLMAISMMRASPMREKQTPEEAQEAEDKEDIAVVPLAIPLLSGPGAVSTAIVHAADAHGPLHLMAVSICCVLIALLTWVALRAAIPLSHWMGRTGVNVAVRLMGLLLAALAVEIFVSGIRVLIPALH